MVVFPNAKINLGLQILSKRDDGYHNLQTIFYPLAIHDALEIIAAKKSTKQIRFASSGLSVGQHTNDNLCFKAYQLIKIDFPALPAIEMHLHKVIPMGAGLGGGSADAAFTLKLLNELFHLQCDNSRLKEYALRLGSDCPFFLYNKPCIATGRGEIFEPLALDLSAYKILLVNPGIHVSTALAFSHIHPCSDVAPLAVQIAAPMEKWRNILRNDFEATVFDIYPEISLLKNTLYDHGAIYASMSGSGSSVFGIFPKTFSGDIALPVHYFQRWAQ